MRNRKKHINLPIKIPQNIIDVFIEYKKWKEDYSQYPKDHKLIMLKKMTIACKKWHLYNGWSAIAGSFWIHTTIGIICYVSIKKEQPLTIKQCNYTDSYNPWDKIYPQEVFGKIKDKGYCYNWDRYEPLIIV